jgi:hypothetical protein
VIDINAILNLTNLTERFYTAINLAKTNLLRQPDEATLKLADVLDELGKVFSFIEEETVRYLALYFLPDHQNYIECRTSLLKTESGTLAVKGNEARGHCHKISNIYDKHLRRWFHDRLSGAEAQEFQQIFDLLGDMDFHFIRAISTISDWLTEEARITLDMIDADDVQGANRRIRQARMDALPARQAVAGAMGQLRLLQAEFIQAAGGSR